MFFLQVEIGRTPVIFTTDCSMLGGVNTNEKYPLTAFQNKKNDKPLSCNQKYSTNWLERMQKNYIYGIILFEKLTERNTYEFNKIIGKWDVFTETKDRK